MIQVWKMCFHCQKFPTYLPPCIRECKNHGHSFRLFYFNFFNFKIVDIESMSNIMIKRMFVKNSVNCTIFNDEENEDKDDEIASPSAWT